MCICSNGKSPHGRVRAAITWGYKVDHHGNLTVDTPVASNSPSENWKAAAELWNKYRGPTIPGLRRTWSE